MQRQLCSHVMEVCCRQQQSGQTGSLERALCCHCLVLISSSAFCLHPAAPEVQLCNLEFICTTVPSCQRTMIWWNVTSLSTAVMQNNSKWLLSSGQKNILMKLSLVKDQRLSASLLAVLWFPFFTYTTNKIKQVPPLLFFWERNSDLDDMNSIWMHP